VTRTGPADRSGPRRALAIVLAASALVVLAVGVAIPIVLQRNLSAEAVAARGTDLARRPVTVEAVGITFRPGLRIRAEGVEVEGAASAEAVEVELAWWPLLFRRLEPSELHLRGATLLVERAGGFRVRLLHPPGARRAGGGVPSSLPALEAGDGEIVVVDADGRPTGDPTLRIHDLELAPLRPGRPVPLRLSVAVEPGDAARWSVAEARLEAFLELAGDGAPLRISSGRASGRDLVARRLHFGRFEGRFAYADERIAIEALELTGYDGRLEFAGSARLGGTAEVEGRFDARDLDLAAMIADWRGRPSEHAPARLDAHGDLAVPVPGLEHGTGTGRIVTRGGTAPAGSLFSVLLGSIGRLAGWVFRASPDFSPAPSRVERASAGWSLRDDRIHTEDLEVVTDDYTYSAAGSLGLDRTLAFSGSLQLTSRGAQRMVASAALPLPGATAVIPKIPLDVGGRLGAVTLDARVASLPGAATSALTGLVRGGGGLVKDAAGAGKKVLDRVLGGDDERASDPSPGGERSP
jgi:hypothetical protein